MNIKITDKALRQFLDTSASPQEIAEKISLCGPTIDRIVKNKSEYVYEIEVITNRIDTASAQGIARDSAAILKQLGIKAVLKNDPYLEKISLFPNLPKTINFDITDKSLVRRLVAITFENVNISQSPQETKTLLTLCDERPINNAVDITNELTLLYGMPSHIFDFDKLASQKLIIRESIKGEEITTLDNQKNKLNGGDIIIEDGAGRIVDLCGVMGGTVAEVDLHTKNILLIVPTFNASKIRRTSLYLQKRTLASQILEKQPDRELNLPILMKAIQLFKERTGARVSSAVFDSQPLSEKPKEINLNINWANNLIGINIPEKTISKILESLGFIVRNKNENEIICTVPSWRYFDINIKEDLVEEIARVFGYSKLPAILPYVNLSPEPKNPLLRTEVVVKNFLSCQGFNEVYNSSLVSGDLITKTDLDITQHLKLTNALSVEYEYLRTSLVPSILQNIKNNQGKSEEPFYLFELSNIYQKIGDKLPKERSNVCLASTIDYLHTKGYLESLLSHLNLKNYKFATSIKTPEYFVTANTSTIMANKQILGFIGTIKPAILRRLGITSSPTVVELSTEVLVDSIQNNYVFKPISGYPAVIETMTIKSNAGVGDIIEKITASSKLISSVSYTKSYENNHTFKITFSSFEKNLTQLEVNEIKKSIQSHFN
jgi:phenylalanyl-tRNA synthetase beta chain